MDNDYSYADFKNKKELLDAISEYERELSEKTGKNIILVAYSGKKDK